MRRSKTENQLDMFQKFDPNTLESQIKQLESEITRAIRKGDLKKAALLAEEQRILIESQISPQTG